MDDLSSKHGHGGDGPRDAGIDAGSGLPMPSAGHEALVEDDSFADGVDSMVRNESIKEQEGREPEQRSGYGFARFSIAIILVVWLVTGFVKIKDINAFVGVVEKHRVLPDSLDSLLLWVGPAELVMGLLLVFAMGSELRKPFGKLALLVSMSAIVGFMYYISLVDPRVLQKSGCGCLSDYRIASGMEDYERVMKYGFNTILIILHIVALFGPAMVDSRRRNG